MQNCRHDLRLSLTRERHVPAEAGQSTPGPLVRPTGRKIRMPRISLLAWNPIHQPEEGNNQ